MLLHKRQINEPAFFNRHTFLELNWNVLANFFRWSHLIHINIIGLIVLCLALYFVLNLLLVLWLILRPNWYAAIWIALVWQALLYFLPFMIVLNCFLFCIGKYQLHSCLTFWDLVWIEIDECLKKVLVNF